MSKKIVVITGSPRKDGNSFAMTDAFIRAAQAKGHTVTRFDAAMMKIGGCHACETCFKTGKACSFDDDFNLIAPAVLEADALVFTMEGAYDYITEQGWEKDIPRSKVHYINNGVDLEQFDYNTEHFRVEDPDLDDPDTFKVVYTGSIRKVNNLGLLLDAAKCVNDPRVKFLIWGDGDEREALEQRVRDENISNVVFKGKVEKKYIPSIVSRANLNFAHNSFTYLFNYGISFNKLFDYFAAGQPILCDFPCRYNPAINYGAGMEVRDARPQEIATVIGQLAQLPAEGLAQQVYPPGPPRRGGLRFQMPDGQADGRH